MNDNVRNAMATIEAAIHRAQQPVYSSQEQFDTDRMFNAWYTWYATELQKQEVPYNPNSRARDRWLRTVWKAEPHMAGVVNGAVQIDTNRTWNLSGPIRQVTTYANILDRADDGHGWRAFVSKASQSFYCSDMGAIVEVGRAGQVGPMRALYNADPTQFLLTGHRDYPLAYFPRRDEVQLWEPYDFFRVASLPSTDVDFNNLGFCAVSRAVELVKLLMAVYDYDQEMLGARAPKGLLLLQNVTQEQWDEAMAARDAQLDQYQQRHYGGVSVLAQFGPEEIDAKLIALSQLPAEFDRVEVTNQIMYGLALCFGYPPDEFWPVQYGAIGRATETEIHHMRGAGKGGSDFLLSFGERIQDELPPSLIFEFEHRDAQQSMQEAALYQAWADVAQTLYDNGTGIMSLQEVRRLLLDHNMLMNDELTTEDNEGNSQAERLRNNLLGTEALFRAAQSFPDEPIVVYEYPKRRYRKLWERAGSAVPFSFRVQKLPQRTRALLGQNGSTTITDDNIEDAIENAGERYGAETAQLANELIRAA